MTVPSEHDRRIMDLYIIVAVARGIEAVSENVGIAVSGDGLVDRLPSTWVTEGSTLRLRFCFVTRSSFADCTG